MKYLLTTLILFASVCSFGQSRQVCDSITILHARDFGAIGDCSPRDTKIIQALADSAWQIKNCYVNLEGFCISNIRVNHTKHDCYKIHSAHLYSGLIMFHVFIFEAYKEPKKKAF